MRGFVGILVVAFLLSGVSAGTAAPAYPGRALEFIAPAGAGGGWDLTARMTARALGEERLVTVPITVTNMPGGSGAVGIAHMVTRRKGDSHVIAVMGSSLTGTLARKAVPYTFKDVVPIASITGDFQVVAVRRDSSFNSLRVLLDVFRRDPGLITVGGGGSPGALDHLTFSLLGKKVGVDATKVRYVPFDSGGQAMAALLGGSITVLSTSVSEVLPNLEADPCAGDHSVRAPGGLAADSPHRARAGCGLRLRELARFLYAPRHTGRGCAVLGSDAGADGQE